MIEVFGYDTHHKKFLTDLPVSDIPHLLKERKLLLWVDFSAPTPEETRLLETMFHLDPLAIEDCMHPRQLSKLEYFNTYLFFIIQGIVAGNGEHSIKTVEFDGFLADRYLITYHEEPLQSIETSKRSILNGTSRLANGTGYLAYEITDQVIDMYLPVLDHFDEKLAALEEVTATERFAEKTAQEYLKLSSQILNLRRNSLKNQEVFYQLSHTNMKFIDAEEARLFKDVYDHVLRVVDMSEYYQQSLRGILDIHLSLNANRVNQVAQFLTVIATIMLPLSVVTGIYGMNFEWMPYLDDPYGFFYIVGFMFIIATAMLLFFRHRDWI